MRTKKDILTLYLAIIVIALASMFFMSYTKDKVQTIEAQYQQLFDEVIDLKVQIKRLELKIPQQKPISRGIAFTGVRKQQFKITAYDLSFASCGKTKKHPEYGITASGVRVKPWHTIAASKEIPFGTRVYIPYFKDYPNGGLFVVEDRGSAITEGRIDIFMESNKDCFDFGVQYLDAYIIK